MQSETHPQVLFAGVARRHLVRDVLAVAFGLALAGGFVAHAANPLPRESTRGADASTVEARRGAALALHRAAPAPCPVP